jgi:hypothetical protein
MIYRRIKNHIFGDSFGTPCSILISEKIQEFNKLFTYQFKRWRFMSFYCNVFLTDLIDIFTFIADSNVRLKRKISRYAPQKRKKCHILFRCHSGEMESGNKIEQIIYAHDVTFRTRLVNATPHGHRGHNLFVTVLITFSCVRICTSCTLLKIHKGNIP